MKLSLFNTSQTREVIELFTSVFSVSENETEGLIIGNLVSELIATTDPRDLMGCVATLDHNIVGCIFFSRIIVPGGEIAFILSPVAISTSDQGAGVGQKLINYGLDQLKSLSVKFAFTYGDPDFYSKTGFGHISESTIKAPFKLSQPEGWLAQSLDGEPMQPMQGTTKCVEALSDPKYW